MAYRRLLRVKFSEAFYNRLGHYIHINEYVNTKITQNADAGFWVILAGDMFGLSWLPSPGTFKRSGKLAVSFGIFRRIRIHLPILFGTWQRSGALGRSVGAILYCQKAVFLSAAPPSIGWLCVVCQFRTAGVSIARPLPRAAR